MGFIIYSFNLRVKYNLIIDVSVYKIINTAGKTIDNIDVVNIIDSGEKGIYL